MQDDANFIIEIKNRNEDALCYIIEKYGKIEGTPEWIKKAELLFLMKP